MKSALFIPKKHFNKTYANHSLPKFLRKYNFFEQSNKSAKNFPDINGKRVLKKEPLRDKSSAHLSLLGCKKCHKPKLLNKTNLQLCTI